MLNETVDITENNTTQADAEILNDLLKINNDRIEGYERAIAETTENREMDVLLGEMATQSEGYAAELRQLIKNAGVEPEQGTTLSGKIYRLWMEVKSMFATNEKKSIFEACERGEDAALHAYDQALISDLSPETLKVVTTQHANLKASHDKIKVLRNIQ